MFKSNHFAALVTTYGNRCRGPGSSPSSWTRRESRTGLLSGSVSDSGSGFGFGSVSGVRWSCRRLRPDRWTCRPRPRTRSRRSRWCDAFLSRQKFLPRRRTGWRRWPSRTTRPCPGFLRRSGFESETAAASPPSRRRWCRPEQEIHYSIPILEVVLVTKCIES